MITDLNNLVRLSKSQIKPAADVLARALLDDPLYAYFFPNASGRRKKLPYVFKFPVRHGVLYGEVYATSPNLEGVIIWLPSESAAISTWRMLRYGAFSMMLTMGIGPMVRMMRYMEYADAMHKRQAPFKHWYLQLIGVDPVLQGKGYAGTLLRAMFTRIDKEHLPCYLETQNEKNVSIYQHHGFKVVEEFTVPSTDFSNWAMLREQSS